jgi:hypothetical protein
MRTHILIAALLLAATAAHAGPRSLSGAQANPVDAPAQKIQILEAPQPIEAPKLEAPKLEAPALEAPRVEAAPRLEAPRLEPSKTAEQAPAAQPAPVQAAPVEEKPIATKPAETAPVEAAKPVEATPAPAARPVKQARRKQPRHELTVEQHVRRDLRSIERTIKRHVGFALVTPVVIPYYW